jgi:glycosyltransferase involved in cell wall biosynthesis
VSDSGRKRVAFIAGEFPKASETFLLRELRTLRERSLDFVIVATARLKDIPEAEGIDAPVILRPAYLSLHSLAAELRFALAHPLRYVGLLATLFRGHRRRLRELVQVMLNVPRALAVGYELRRLGVARVHALWANFPATLGWIIARALDMEFSFSAHARDVWVDGRMLREKAKLARHVVVCNRASAARLEEIIGTQLARKVTLLHHGMDVAELPRRAAAVSDTVVAAGRFEPKKGFDVLIEACGILARRGNPVRCVIVGEGRLRGRLEALAARVGHGLVEIRPWMFHDELMKLIASAAVVVAPSVVSSDGDHEGIPNIVLEAMAVGTPVVASAVGGTPEVVTDGKTGCLTDPGSAQQLADAIGQIAAKRGQRADIIGRARELIEREFTLSDTVARLERILQE